MGNFLIEAGLYLTYAMIAVAVIAAVVFPVIFIIQDPKKAKASLLGIAGLAVIFVLAYMLSSNELYKDVQNPTVSKLVGGGLIMFYIMFAGAIVAAIYSEVAKLFK